MAISKKGVESIIAVLIVVMITVASAGSFYFWYQRVQQSAQGATEQSTSTFLNQINTCVKMPYFAYNLLTNESESQVQNCGSTSITIGDGDDNVLISSQPCAFAVDSRVCDTCPLRIGPGAIGKFKMNFNLAACSGTVNKTAASVMADQENMQHKISFSMEKSTISVSKTFTPQKTLTCIATLSEMPDQVSYVVNPPSPYFGPCMNYTASLLTDIPQTFDININIENWGGAGFVYDVWIYNDSECANLEWFPPHNVTVEAHSNATFYGKLFMGGYPFANITATVTSLDLATCKASDIFQVTHEFP